MSNKTEEEYFIWSVEHNAWWRPNHNGYCASWSQAGRYSKDEAFRISARANWSSLNEVPVPISFFEFQVRLHQRISAVGVEG
jgi:hypothetical protein